MGVFWNNGLNDGMTHKPLARQVRRFFYASISCALLFFTHFSSQADAQPDREQPYGHQQAPGFLTFAENSASSKQESLDWSDLPGWENLPADPFQGSEAGSYGLPSDNTIDQATKERFDHAYTQMLLGDLEAAEADFRRIILHYPTSTYAVKAEQQLMKIAAARKTDNTRQKLSKSHFYPFHDDADDDSSSLMEQQTASTSDQKTPINSSLEPSDPANVKFLDGLVARGSIDDFVMNVGDRIFFDNGKSALTPDAKRVLESQIKWLTQYKNYTLTIEGHSYEQGPSDYNSKLSKERAEAVLSYFASKGIDKGRITLSFHGKDQPIVLCQKESCVMQNRRVVIKLNSTQKQ